MTMLEALKSALARGKQAEAWHVAIRIDILEQAVTALEAAQAAPEPEREE